MSIARLLSRLTRTCRLRLWLAVGIGLLPATGRAYQFEGSTWDWDTQVVLNLQLGTPPTPLSDGSTTWNQVAVAAMQEWNQYLGGGVHFSSNETVLTPQQRDGNNTVSFNPAIYGEHYGSDTLAVTVLLSDGSTTHEADVMVDATKHFDSYRGNQHYDGTNGPVYDLRRVLLHEFGHVLGLDHTPQSTAAIMAPAITNLDTLQYDDIAGVVALYGTPNGLPLVLSSLDVAVAVGRPYTYSLVTVGGVTGNAASGLPPGLNFDPGMGIISGTPSQTGTYPVTLTLSNDHGTSTVTLMLSVVGQPVVTSSATATATVGQPFRFQITADGRPYRFDYSSTPLGLKYDPGTGVISGTPTVPGQAYVSYTVFNVAGSTGGLLSLTVQPEYTVTTLRQGDDGLSFSQTGPLMAGTDGNLYWANSNLDAILQITPGGNVTTLHTFQGADGVGLNYKLVRTDDGSFYGTTDRGGANLYGTMFRLAPDGTLTTLHSFSQEEGGYPSMGLVQGRDGAFYGLKEAPGSVTWLDVMAYRVTPDGVPTALHIFDRSQEGLAEEIIVGTDGNLYGVGIGGYGSPSCIFRITPDGVFTKLYVFGNIPAPQPNGTLVQAIDGSLYGVIGNGSYGNLYRVTLDGRYTEFNASQTPSQAAWPSKLSTGKDGFIYAVGSYSGAGYQQALLRYAADGTVALIHFFASSLVNSFTPAAPVQGADGALYYADQDGSVYRLQRTSASAHPSFFSGEAALNNGVYYLAFPGGSPFGYYSYLSDPKYIYHFDMGYEYVFDAADGKSGVYLYDFKSASFFYTSPTFGFPYLYDFSLNTVLYYYPDPNNAGRYNTDGVRYFYNFATGKIITK